MEIIDRIPGDHGRIARRTVKDQISDKLAYMIHSGLLRVGDELPSERNLASSLGVSRETVRAAVALLRERRMIEINHGSRTKVLGTGELPLHESVSTLSNLRGRTFGEVAEARAAVEVQVLALAAERIRSSELKRLAQLLRDQEQMLEDPVGFQISDRMFHTTMYGACRNTLLFDVVCDFYDYALEYRRRALQRVGAIGRSVAEHRGLLHAFQKRNPKSVVAAAQKHLEQVRKTTQQEMA
jgi:DNA-binding FadR family transcriptional regulator